MEQNVVTVGAVRFLNVPLDDFKTPRKKTVKKRIQIKLAARCGSWLVNNPVKTKC